MVILDIAAYVGQNRGIRRILDFRLCVHQVAEALEAGHAVGEHLNEIHQLDDRAGERRDVEREGDEVDIIHPVPHDEEAARRDGDDLQDTHGEFDAGMIDAHGFIPVPLGELERVVRRAEFPVLGLLVGEGLGGADAGDAGVFSHRRPRRPSACSSAW